MTGPSAKARALLADQLVANDPRWRNNADSIRSGVYGNVWTEAALIAIDKALGMNPDDEA